jgi:hypothetical protein
VGAHVAIELIELGVPHAVRSGDREAEQRCLALDLLAVREVDGLGEADGLLEPVGGVARDGGRQLSRALPEDLGLAPVVVEATQHVGSVAEAHVAVGDATRREVSLAEGSRANANGELGTIVVDEIVEAEIRAGILLGRSIL